MVIDLLLVLCRVILNDGLTLLFTLIDHTELRLRRSPLQSLEQFGADEALPQFGKEYPARLHSLLPDW